MRFCLRNLSLLQGNLRFLLRNLRNLRLLNLLWLLNISFFDASFGLNFNLWSLLLLMLLL
jgi:hypothetical protein